MTSTYTPFGFKSARELGHSPNSEGMAEYRINNGFNTNLFTGDHVGFGTGALAGYLVQASTSAVWPIGVFQGVNYVDSDTKQPRWRGMFIAGVSSADSVIKARVISDPNRVYTIQADASVSIGDIGLNFDVTLGAGSTLLGTSQFGLKASTRNTSVGVCKVVDVYDVPGNAWSDAYPIVVVKFVQSFMYRVSTT